jgi:SAM-dependent methyltransferase
MLDETTTKLMNDEQKSVVNTQKEKHSHEDFVVDYDVSGEKDILEGFLIKKDVWNPLIASGRYHARYLFYHNELFLNKTVLEIGCGTGLMGIVMAKYGAKKVVMSDISEKAVENTKLNIKKFGLEKNTSVVKGDLFESIEEKFDLITWMIPFFAGYPEEGDTISASMIMPPELFERFLEEAKGYLKKDGIILIPSFALGGDLTDPAKVAPKFGYEVKTTWSHKSINNLQQGMIYMHELKLA